MDISPETLLGIAGKESNLFDVTNFEELEGGQAISEAVYVRRLAFLAERKPRTQALKMRAEEFDSVNIQHHERGGWKAERPATQRVRFP